jgi:hypothetical protein
MVTCRSSHRIESLRDEGVGKTLVVVAVGSGVTVSVVVTGVGDDPLWVAQAVRSKNTMNRMGNTFFNGYM